MLPPAILSLSLMAGRWPTAKWGRTFRFGDHHETMAFVNAVAWISHREDHHQLTVGYAGAAMRYWDTRDRWSCRKRDFICAAKVVRLFAR